MNAKRRIRLALLVSENIKVCSLDPSSSISFGSRLGSRIKITVLHVADIILLFRFSSSVPTLFFRQSSQMRNIWLHTDIIPSPWPFTSSAASPAQCTLKFQKGKLLLLLRSVSLQSSQNLYQRNRWLLYGYSSDTYIRNLIGSKVNLCETRVWTSGH